MPRHNIVPSGEVFTYDAFATATEEPCPYHVEAITHGLTDAEFETVMGTSKDAYASMAKWKQQNLKKAKELF